MKVKNINGRRQNSCNCGSWLDHWVRVCGWPLPQHCAATTCMAKPQLGAHVQRDSATDISWYIVPLCVKHSIRAASLEILDSTPLVSAHVNDTCGKQMPIGNVWPHELEATFAASAVKFETEMIAARNPLGLSTRGTPGRCDKRKPTRDQHPVLRLTY